MDKEFRNYLIFIFAMIVVLGLGALSDRYFDQQKKLIEL